MEKFIYTLGLGLGDPELVTVKAVKIMESSDVIIVPQSSKLGKSVARDIVLNYIGEEKLKMYYFPMNNNQAELDSKYQELAVQVKQLCDEGKKVAFVTMGDPTIFSTSNYLCAELNKIGIEVKHVPGINTINTLSNLLGVPVTVKGENFGVYEMPSEVEKTVALIKQHPTTVFMKVNQRVTVLQQAVKQCQPQFAKLVEKAGLEGETVYDLTGETLPEQPVYLSSAMIKR
jgi:precorrin-2/cobalt-factor-2 C20-methyltransferase